jgi:Short C-terminal domain
MKRRWSEMKLPTWSEFTTKLCQIEKDIDQKVRDFKNDHPILDKAIKTSIFFFPSPFDSIARNDSTLPVSAKAGFEYDIEKKQITYIFDMKNFPANSNKIEQVGLVRRRKFLIECNGRGGFNNKELRSPEDRLKAAKALRDKNLITEEEYNKKRNEILESL